LAAGALALACIVLLAFFAAQQKPVSVSQITPADDGKLVDFTGKVTSVRVSGSNRFYKLCGASCVDCTVFAGTASRLAVDFDLIGRDAVLSCTGIAGFYNGQPQVVASSLEVLGLG